MPRIIHSIAIMNLIKGIALTFFFQIIKPKIDNVINSKTKLKRIIIIKENKTY